MIISLHTPYSNTTLCSTLAFFTPLQTLQKKVDEENINLRNLQQLTKKRKFNKYVYNYPKFHVKTIFF